MAFLINGRGFGDTGKLLLEWLILPAENKAHLLWPLLCSSLQEIIGYVRTFAIRAPFVNEERCIKGIPITTEQSLGTMTIYLVQSFLGTTILAVRGISPQGAITLTKMIAQLNNEISQSSTSTKGKASSEANQSSFNSSVASATK